LAPAKSTIATVAPCAAIIFAVAKPSPFNPAPPVMTATFPANNMRGPFNNAQDDLKMLANYLDENLKISVIMQQQHMN
jgi:hypothetical protein